MANQTKITASPGGREVIVERVFDAPREKVFEAWTKPELVKQWLGPRNLKMTIDKWELKPGGLWSYTSTDDKGDSYSFHGVFHEVAAPERLIQTFEYEGLPEPGHVALDTLHLEDVKGKTKVTGIMVFQTPEDRDGMVQSGMEKGVNQGHERLDELLTKL